MDGVHEMERGWCEQCISQMSLLAFRQPMLAGYLANPFKLIF